MDSLSAIFRGDAVVSAVIVEKGDGMPFCDDEEENDGDGYDEHDTAWSS